MEFWPRMTPVVTWRPPQARLHYTELYSGIYEYLRQPPSNRFRNHAMEYLRDIRRNLDVPFPYRHMQQDRIAWILEWIRALPDDSDECSDADTVGPNDETFLE